MEEKLIENFGSVEERESEISENPAGKKKGEPESEWETGSKEELDSREEQGSREETGSKEKSNFAESPEDIDPPYETNIGTSGCKSCAEIRIGELMTRKMVTAHEDALLEEVFTLFEKHSYHTLPVLNSEEELVGIIDQDIVLEILLFSQIPRAKHTHLAAVRSLGVHAKDIMITHPMTISPDSSLTYAADLMMKHRFDRVCITEDKKLVGIITKRDIVKEVSKRRALEKG